MLLQFLPPFSQTENVNSPKFWDKAETKKQTHAHTHTHREHLLLSSLALNAVYVALKPL